MRLEFVVRAASQMDILIIGDLLDEAGIKKNLSDFSKSRTMVAVDRLDNILSYAIADKEKHRMEFYCFEEGLGRKQKSRMKAAFDSRIFSRNGQRDATRKYE